VAESRPPISEEIRQLNRSLTEKVLDRAASDPRWKQQLLDDPEAAMQTADFPETQQLLEAQASAEAPEEYEVRGQAPWQPRCQWYCLNWTSRWENLCSGSEV
jgi:hypothetical protein